jgi:glutathione synthase/RimK-type ligase-like ATP-grasp enzyme
MIVLYSKPGKESALTLAKALNVPAMYAFDQPNLTGHLVFNYGTSALNKSCTNWINNPKSCRVSIDKRLTFSMLHSANIPTVHFALDKSDIKKSWKIVVVRKDATGNQGDSLDYCHRGEDIPDADLYTEYYDHKCELRIVVFKGMIAGRYMKEEKHKMWELTPVDSDGFKQIDKQCIKAAKYLKLEYVGVDVLANTEEDFRILEVNSAPIITEEVTTFIKAQLS